MTRKRKDEIVDLYFQGRSPPIVVEEIPELEAPGTAISTGVKGGSKEAKTEKEKRNMSLKINWVPLNTLTALTGPPLIEEAQ